MVQAGAMGNSDNYRPELVEEEDDKVVLMVHDTKPPFLDGRSKILYADRNGPNCQRS